ncbi:MAG: ATP-binding protein [Thermoplasmata archaeon]|nr:ATP-binding protein [Thermoplasmata archaeon]
MRIAIASGKGGTGKTTIATNLALSLEHMQFLDCDVEEPNSNIFLGLELKKIKDVTIPIPNIDKEKCTLCGKCSAFCQYNALAVLPNDILFFPELCHGCGGCTLVCPENAITEVGRTIGVIEGGRSDSVEFYHGLLNVGEAMATPVIAALKELIDDEKDVILDSPPGAACPVIETVEGSDYCLLVTEPTPFGLHDLKIAVSLLRDLSVPFGVIINRDGVGDSSVEEYCQEEGIPLLLKIPQDREIARLYSLGKPFVQEMPEWKGRFKALFETIKIKVRG